MTALCYGLRIIHITTITHSSSEAEGSDSPSSHAVSFTNLTHLLLLYRFGMVLLGKRKMIKRLVSINSFLVLFQYSILIAHIQAPVMLVTIFIVSPV